MSQNSKGQYQCIVCKNIIFRGTDRKRMYCSEYCKHRMKYIRTKIRPDKNCILCRAVIPANRLYCGKQCGYLWRKYAKPQLLEQQTH